MRGMTGQWRFYVGQWEDGGPGDWTHEDQTVDTWQQGHDLMHARLQHWAADGCKDCREQAAQDSAYLATLSPGEEFVGNVEGEDYLLIRADRGDIDDLWAQRIRPPVGSRRWHRPWRRWLTVTQTDSAPFDEVAAVDDDGRPCIVKVHSLQEAKP
jgi:hypothetical protein